MRSINAFYGAPVLVIFYVISLFLTNFGFGLEIYYTIALFYSLTHLFFRKNLRYKGVKNTKHAILLQSLLIIYVVFIYLIHELGLMERISPVYWELNSSLKYLSIAFSSVVILIAQKEELIKSLIIIKYVSYFIIIASFLFYILPNSFNFLASDAASKYRFNGGINSYIIAGQFLIAGCISHLYLSKNLTKGSVFLWLALFMFAVIATKDRTSILSLSIVYLILIYRSTLIYPIFLFRVRRSIFIIFLTFSSLYLSFYLFQNTNESTIKSTMHRIVLSVRSYQLFQESFPIGFGPGTQAKLMFDKDIVEFGLMGGLYQDNISRELNNFHSFINTDRVVSPHNTYFEYATPFGFLGLLYILGILSVQLTSIKDIFIKKDNSNVFFDSFAVSSLIFFNYSSLGGFFWIYLIYYKVSKDK